MARGMPTTDTDKWLANGLVVHRGYFDPVDQRMLADVVEDVLAQAPLYRPTMPRWGTPLSVRMSNCGELGWVTDKSGYRYQATHPVTKACWPAIPVPLLNLWHDVTDGLAPPEACLINFYDGRAKLGLHVDSDEDEPSAPVVSVSLGDEANFRIGGARRSDPTTRIRLSSGDVVVMGGASRHFHHGIERIFPSTSELLASGGRINLTLRRVTAFADETP